MISQIRQKNQPRQLLHFRPSSALRVLSSIAGRKLTDHALRSISINHFAVTLASKNTSYPDNHTATDLRKSS